MSISNFQVKLWFWIAKIKQIKKKLPFIHFIIRLIGVVHVEVLIDDIGEGGHGQRHLREGRLRGRDEGRRPSRCDGGRTTCLPVGSPRHSWRWRPTVEEAGAQKVGAVDGSRPVAGGRAGSGTPPNMSGGRRRPLAAASEEMHETSSEREKLLGASLG